MIVSRNGVVSPTTKLSAGERQNSFFSHFSPAHGSDGFACPFNLAWSKPSCRLLLSKSIFVQPKSISSWSDLAHYVYMAMTAARKPCCHVTCRKSASQQKRGKEKLYKSCARVSFCGTETGE